MARRRRLRALTGAVLLALLAGSACTGGGGEKKAQPEVPKPLKRLWDTKVGDAATTGELGWVTDDTVMFWEPDAGAELTGFDAGSGKRRWKLALPEGATEVCQVSEDVNEQGVGGVVFATGDKGACTLAAAVNSRTGKVLWSKGLGKGGTGKEEPAVSVSEKALSVALDCGDRRLRLKDGGALPTVPPGGEHEGESCSHDSARTGKHIAVRHEKDSGEAAFAVYDADTGKELWRRKTDRVGSALDAVLADDPLTLVTREDGQRYIRTFDGNGKPVHRLGKELHNGASRKSAFVAHGVLVTSFNADPKTYAYDLRTGKELWSKALDARAADAVQPLGVSGGSLVAETSVVPKGRKLPQPWLRGYDLRDGTQRTLGRLKQLAGDGASPSVVHKQRLYTVTTGTGARNVRLASYALPKQGDSVRYATQPPSEPDGWRKDGLRADEVVTACEAVTAATREKMMLRGDRPPPDDCTWEEWDGSRDGRRELRVQVQSYGPGGEKSGYDEQSEDWKGTTAVRGLGDQAKAVVLDDSAKLLVRYRNVTVEITTRSERQDHGTTHPTRQMLESAARAAAVDVLKELGAKVRQAADPSPGETAKAEPVCGILKSDGARLVPGGKAHDGTSRGAAGTESRCTWRNGDDETPDLSADVTAVHDAVLTGRKAGPEAAAILKERRGKDDKRMSGIGDEAFMDRYEFENGRHRNHTLTARQGNVLVSVSYGRWNQASKQELDTEVKRLVRKVLAAH